MSADSKQFVLEYVPRFAIALFAFLCTAFLNDVRGSLKDLTNNVADLNTKMAVVLEQTKGLNDRVLRLENAELERMRALIQKTERVHK